MICTKRIRTKRRSGLSMFAVVISAILILAGCGKSDDSQSQAEPAIVASTSWTALIAKAAGAGEVTVLAPAELRHPPEYDYRPADIDKVKQAQLIISAGYEPFMKKLLEAAGISGENHYQVVTENTPENLKKQARELAAKMGTTDAEQAWEAEFDNVVADLKAKAEAQQLSQKKAIVQKHMVPMARLFGFEIVAEIAEEPSPARTAELAALKPDLIIDNFHNPQGEAVAEVAGVPRVEFRNFPAPEHQQIQDLLMDNAKALGLH
jgi:zinc transport system substrate-binding protein/iron/zinc/copper transport system substrate-binding protein